MVKRHPKDEPIGMGEESEDSDWENETGQADNEEEPKQEFLLVLMIGSFTRYAQHATVAVGQTSLIFPRSWKCLFFYLCTDVIQFAPLKSQGANARTRHSQGQATLGKGSLTCSPKAIYSLATAVSPSPHASSSSTSLFLTIHPALDGESTTTRIQ